MKKLIFTCLSAFLFLSLVGCGTYNVSLKNRLNVSKVLAVTVEGDTVAVPIDDLLSKYHTGYYNNLTFSFNDRWINGYYFPYYLYQDLYRWRSPLFLPTPAPRLNTPIYRYRNDNRRYDQFNRPNYRSQRPSEGNRNGRRGSGREIIPPRQTQPRIAPDRQPGQVRRGSQPPSVQQPIQRNSPSGQRGGRPIKQQE